MTDNIPQGCTDPAARETMLSLLDETHPWSTWSFVDEALSHWKSCPGCQSDFSNGEERLASLRRNLGQGTRDEISFLRKSYLAAKYGAGVEDDDGAQCRVLAHLAAAGDLLQEALWSITTSTIPFMGFSPLLAAIDTNNDEIGFVLAGALEFFVTLSQEDQEFVAAATAACQLFERSSPSMQEARELAQNHEEDTHKQRLQIYEWAIGHSPISPASLRRALELGAANIAQEYVRITQSHIEQHSRRVSALSAKGESSLSRISLDELRRELLHDFDDFSESMKATQMELFRLIEKGRASDDPSPQLVEILGSELFLSLHARTKQYLRTSEVNYRNPRTSHDEQISTLMLVQAYENEVNVRIKIPLLRRLAEEGHADFPQKGEIKLVQHHRPNNRVTSGQLLRAIEDDTHLQEILRERGLDPRQFVTTGKPVIDLRNRVMHQDFRPEDVQVARDLILIRDRGALRVLVPEVKGVDKM